MANFHEALTTKRMAMADAASKCLLGKMSNYAMITFNGEDLRYVST